MINVQKVTFSYGQQPALREISLEETEPVITGLWGRNGSGKTTLMKILAGQEKPEKGTVLIMGLDPYNNIEAMQNICYIQEDHPFSSIWDIRDAMRFGSYFNKNWNQEIAEKLIDVFKVPEKKKIAKFSKGMKSAVQIIIGLASCADITILDEPTNGLDANMRKKFYKVLQESYDMQPRLIMISTHHIEEIQALCESLIVINDESILLHQSMDEVREKGIWLAGEREKVEDLVGANRIIEQHRMGSTVKVMVDLPYSKHWKQLANEYGISIEKAKMQDYLLNITEVEEVRG